MERKRILRIVGSLLVVAALLLSACGGGTTSDTPQIDNSGTIADDDPGAANDNGDEGNAEPEPTSAPEDQIPDSLVLHPDAIDLVADPIANTYVYVVPMMVAETTEYMLKELKDRGWEELGQPTVMGHLATLTMKMDKDRLTISMQDNEISETTRVQMLLMEQ